jgi:GNAT superfamily N-acetyltransferase
MDELLRRWQRGWGLCRGLRPATERVGQLSRTPAALEVSLGLPDRERELFALPSSALDEPIEDALDTVEPTWLTVTTHTPEAVAARLEDAGLRVFPERKLLMTRALRDHPRQAPPPQYALEVVADGAIERVRVLDRYGAVAARGMTAITGADAVMHDVLTDPAHRRRGLGSVVMGELALRAGARGADTGLLMATVEGGHLYRRLGWLPEATMITATVPTRAAA